MQDKEKLKKLIDIFEELLKIKGNEWLIDAILEKIKSTSTIDEISKHSVIQDIHEHCIEKKIEKQAIEFYSDFKIDSIKQQLVEDYKKMEHERRRDDFEGFCLAMFQQIETIVNFCFELSDFKEKINKNKLESAFLEWNANTKTWERKSEQSLLPFLLIQINPLYKSQGNSEIKQGEPFYKMNSNELDKYFDSNGFPIVDYNPNKKSWSFLHRFRAILFFYYFNQKLKQQDFEAIYFPGNELYNMRNQNHRESKATPKQAEIVNNIKGKESKYYFKFYGFLVDFVSHVNLNMIKPPIAQNITKKTENTKNTIGANNPALQELLKKMNEKK